MFKKTVNGVQDPNINRDGRPLKGDAKPTRRELRERELLMLLRKIRPHVSDSIIEAARIMKNEVASDQNRLRACTVLMEAYRKLTLDLYDGNEEDEGTEIQQQNQPIFSLKMITGDEIESNGNKSEKN